MNDSISKYIIFGSYKNPNRPNRNKFYSYRINTLVHSDVVKHFRNFMMYDFENIITKFNFNSSDYDRYLLENVIERYGIDYEKH